MPAEHHQTTWCAQQAINFIEANAGSGRPWLFSVNTFDPHHHFDPPPEYLQRYLDRLDDIPLPNAVPGELEHKPVFQQVDHHGAYNTPGRYAAAEMSEYDHRLVRAAYWAMVDLIDAQVGRMLGALEATGQLENTLVIFTSDHGEMLGDHGIYAKGPYFYEPLVRVPLIVSWPGGFEGGRRSGAMVEMLDLTPALLDAAGLPHHPGMQGRSLWPLLAGEAALDAHREDVYCEYYNTAMHHDPRAYATMVRTERYKLVKVHGLPSGELYDLADDPNETRNLWNEPAYRETRLAMTERLCDRMAWTIDPLPVREAPW
jgi:arylsulfatase A-like enzyme